MFFSLTSVAILVRKQDDFQLNGVLLLLAKFDDFIGRIKPDRVALLCLATSLLCHSGAFEQTKPRYCEFNLGGF